ncbi:unnamed protein product [[Candida] boidinii]|uniref:Unnamed protein product n=1 Tax=Candida boidinii TaxID=5477 RepID=A0A9W6SWX1_CANBO|nr:hypothetical protein B5S30_g1648 [[Candida] boidinii]OWB83769.1 hypothetical protein B5S33_g2402 [[Candida] boidinii]GME68795.1 unnamed protein product [[Candida] boidinii]GMG17244.1 unnamed protein product [[Candida] boidinii]
MSGSIFPLDKELPPLPPEAYINNSNSNNLKNNTSHDGNNNNNINSNKQHQYQQLQHHNSVHSQNSHHSHHSHHSHNSYHQSNHSNSTINLSRSMSNGAGGGNNSNQSGQHTTSRSSSSSLSSLMSSALPQSGGIRRNSTQTLNNFNISNSNIQLNTENNNSNNRAASLISSPLSPQYNEKIPTTTSTPTLTTAPSPQNQFHNIAGSRHSLLAGQHSYNSLQSGQDSASSSALPSPLPLSLSQKKKMLPKLILEPHKLNKNIIINQQSPAVDSIHTANNSPSPFLEQRSLNRRNLKKLTLSPMEPSYNNNTNDNNLSSSTTPLFTGVTSANDSGVEISSATIDTPNSKNMSIGKSLGNPKGLSLDLSSVNTNITNTRVSSSSSEVAIENLTSNYFNYRDPERKASTDELIENIRNLELGLEYQIPIKADELVTLKKLGSGNSGSVSKVLHLPTQKTMARKIIHLETKEVIQSQIIRELRIMHECDSPFITGFYGSFLHEGDVVICMEYIDCGSLDKVFRLTGSFPEFILKHAAFSVLSGLNYLYDNHRIIHRDIKPSNILLDSKGNIKLCDFGVSRELISSMADTFVGTSTYMSPERIQGGVYSVKGDVWSLGLVLYELASGKFAFGGGGQIASACKNVHDDKDTNTITTLNTLNTTTSTNTSNSASTAELDSNQVNGGGGGGSGGANGNSGVGSIKNQSSRGGDSILDLLQSIVNEKPPTLKTKDGFSSELCDFVDLCLRKEKDRPDPHILMKHKFLADFVEADGNKITSKYRGHIKKWAKNVRRVQKGKTIK